jgi:hypothetical protein
MTKDTDGDEIVVSQSGTRHIVNNGLDRTIERSALHAFRISTLCGFSIKPEDQLPLEAGVQDCPFCAAEPRPLRRIK